jgi:hypothetical protein
MDLCDYEPHPLLGGRRFSDPKVFSLTHSLQACFIPEGFEMQEQQTQDPIKTQTSRYRLHQHTAGSRMSVEVQIAPEYEL